MTEWTRGCSVLVLRGPKKPSLLGTAVLGNPKPVRLPLDSCFGLFDSTAVDETPLQRPSTVASQPAVAAPPPQRSASQLIQDTHLLKLTQNILTRRTRDTVQRQAQLHPALYIDDSAGKTSAIQLTWTDTGGQVQFAPIVTLSLRK